MHREGFKEAQHWDGWEKVFPFFVTSGSSAGACACGPPTARPTHFARSRQHDVNHHYRYHLYDHEYDYFHDYERDA